jgi:hypothetical protein
MKNYLHFCARKLLGGEFPGYLRYHGYNCYVGNPRAENPHPAAQPSGGIARDDVIAQLDRRQTVNPPKRQ